MKLKPHTKYQIISVFAMIAVFVLTVLYSKGYFDFSFITRRSDFGTLNGVEIERLETEHIFDEDRIEEDLNDAMDGMDDFETPPESDDLYFPNPEDFPTDNMFEENMPNY